MSKAKREEQLAAALLQTQEQLAAARARCRRIYLVGGHRVGKTTLGRWISSVYKLPFLNEVARKVLADMQVLTETRISLEDLRVDVDRAGRYQTEVFERQMEEAG